MATAVIARPETSKAHVQAFERKILAVKSAVAELPGKGIYDQLLMRIHRPRWTTPAEAIFIDTTLDSILVQVQLIAQLQRQLIVALDAVGRE